MKRLILIAVVLSVGMALAGWRGRFDEQFAAASTAEWTPARLNPIAWYKGDGDALDSARANNGTWIGTAAYTTGKVGSAFNTKYPVGISIPSSAAPTSEITVSAWINHNKIAGIGWGVAQAAGATWASPYVNFGLAARGSNVLWRVTTQALETTSRPICVGTFFHVVGVRSAAKMSIYVNGALVRDANTTGALQAAPTQPVAIGYISPQPSQESYSGLIDDVLIFDRALTPSEIKKLYDETVKQNGEPW